jgi:hypothetical protein
MRTVSGTDHAPFSRRVERIAHVVREGMYWLQITHGIPSDPIEIRGYSSATALGVLTGAGVDQQAHSSSHRTHQISP